MGTGLKCIGSGKILWGENLGKGELGRGGAGGWWPIRFGARWGEIPWTQTWASPIAGRPLATARRTSVLKRKAQ